MAGSIDDVDTVVPPRAGSGSRGNGDTAFLLLLHPVHHGIAIMDFTNLVGSARIKKDSFGRRRLTGIDVSHDADITVPIEGGCAGHVFPNAPANYQR